MKKILESVMGRVNEGKSVDLGELEMSAFPHSPKYMEVVAKGTPEQFKGVAEYVNQPEFQPGVLVDGKNVNDFVVTVFPKAHGTFDGIDFLKGNGGVQGINLYFVDRKGSAFDGKGKESVSLGKHKITLVV